jgi:dipeptidyl aminopeptidase/acylaminoacyl peptidase
LSASLSPDGRRAALTIQGESRDLWTLSIERGTLSRLTSGDATEYDPVWTRDGRELLYVVDRPPYELHRIATGAPDSGRPLWNEPAVLDTNGIAVSPDGHTIAFTRTEERTGRNIYSRPLDGSEPPRPIRASRSEEYSASFSPDARSVVYQSDETGRPEIYVESFPASGERVQVSSDGGTEPRWAGNGEIFYRHDDEVRVVAPRRAGRLEFDAPRSLFAFPIAPGGNSEFRTFDVTRDGARILAVTIPAASRPRQIEIVADWTSELARLAPRESR